MIMLSARSSVFAIAVMALMGSAAVSAAPTPTAVTSNVTATPNAKNIAVPVAPTKNPNEGHVVLDRDGKVVGVTVGTPPAAQVSSSTSSDPGSAGGAQASLAPGAYTLTLNSGTNHNVQTAAVISSGTGLRMVVTDASGTWTVPLTTSSTGALTGTVSKRGYTFTLNGRVTGSQASGTTTVSNASGRVVINFTMAPKSLVIAHDIPRENPFADEDTNAPTPPPVTTASSASDRFWDWLGKLLCCEVTNGPLTGEDDE